MLFPRHPKPVGRRRAVAEMTVAARQAAAIEPGHVLHVADEGRQAGALVARGQGVGAEPTLRFTVVYGLREYLAILREAMPLKLLAWERSRGRSVDGRLSLPTRMALKLLLPVVGIPTFLLKKRRMPACRFTVDATGIERATADGRLRVAWHDVVAVHRLRRAWLVDKGDGGLPIPHRCLDDAQQATFERLLVSHFPRHTPF